MIERKLKNSGRTALRLNFVVRTGFHIVGESLTSSRQPLSSKPWCVAGIAESEAVAEVMATVVSIECKDQYLRIPQTLGTGANGAGVARG